MPKTLDDTARQRLLAAIEKAAGYVNDGEAPNAGIAKAASECGIPASQVKLMVHAYNTGRTNQQRASAETLMDKAADFPLADTEEVLEQLYPKQVKTAADNYRASTISVEYAIPPTGLLARRERLEKLAGSLAVDWRAIAGGRIAAPAPYPGDPVTRVKKACGLVQRHHQKVEELRRQQSVAFDKMADSFNSLTDYFRSPSSLPIPVVRDTALVMHGGKAEQLFDQLIHVTPGLTKMARSVPAGPVGWVGAPFTIIDQFMADLGNYRTAKAEHAKQAALNGEVEALLHPFAGKPPESVLGGPLSMTKKALGASDVLGPVALSTSIYGNISNTYDPKEKAKLEQTMLDRVTDPVHESRLRNMRAQTTLQSLVRDDPVISQYPEEAISAYNEIVEMSPHAADQMMLLRSLMRQRLEQGTLDPFQVDQLLGMEEKLRKRNVGMGLQSQQGLPNESVLG